MIWTYLGIGAIFFGGLVIYFFSQSDSFNKFMEAFSTIFEMLAEILSVFM